MGRGGDQAGRPPVAGGAPSLSAVERLPAAYRDLATIWSYVAEHDPEAADELVDRIEDRLRLLADNPRLGPPRPGPIAGLRSFTVGRYLLFYQPTDGGILLVRVLHGARDVTAVLGER